MDPLTMSLLLSAGTAAVKGGIGAAQYAKGRRLAKSAVRPEYEIPSGIKDYLNNAQSAALQSELPGQKAIEEKLSASTGAGIRAAEQGASSSAGLMATIAGLKGQEQQQVADLGVAGAQFQDANKQRLQQALLQYGSAQDKEFDINKMMPFEQQSQAAQGMQGAGMQNIMTGIEGVAGAASMGLGGNKTGQPTQGQPNTPFGMSNTTQRLGMQGQNNALGSQTNVQKYMNAKRKGFAGDYNSWISSQPLGF